MKMSHLLSSNNPLVPNLTEHHSFWGVKICCYKYPVSGLRAEIYSRGLICHEDYLVESLILKIM